ncbi:nuclease-related domain-containing protein [Imperialibacter roseus]|uniref:Nuclease-related domain-containing protein n=1 Tax=Imperialibacter roseus TaxID=1324217 RepID=A0ABZ0IX80_9BACT|nr:nuclease-related domain-containing protein [Imperialibacter roseus]WOK08545.1 nuclease-related domain-containing protein [Imperialibacter roseus]
MLRDTSEVLMDIKQLVRTKGFLYTICLILVDDFHLNVEAMHETDYRSRLNKNEILMLLGFLIQDEISLETPKSPFELIELKKKTYHLMEELHYSTTAPFQAKIEQLIKNPSSQNAPNDKDFFGDENMFIEPIFYSGDGIYDIQYLEFLKRKYKYNEEWLNRNADFDFDNILEIVTHIKKLHQDKFQRVNFIGLKENKQQILKDLRKGKSIPKKERDDFLALLEFYQFSEFFEAESNLAKGLDPTQITENGWKSFYLGLLDLFSITPSDFLPKHKISRFLKKFSIANSPFGRNENFQNIGDFNILSASPIIPFGSDKYFVPIIFSVFEAVYESPYYWMTEDKSYRNSLAESRGKAGEEIAFELLKAVVGENRIYKSIKIESKRGYDDTDIDVLCILGNKAICVQVKSKKLTQLSRKGNSNQLKTDFKGAVQDAYEQGMTSRTKIIEKNSIFRDENGNRLNIIDNIEDVYILIVTTENYPALTHQARSLESVTITVSSH